MKSKSWKELSYREGKGKVEAEDNGREKESAETHH